MNVNRLERIATRWDESEWEDEVPKHYWGHHPIINEYINSNITPHTSGMLDWLSQNYLKDGPLELGLSLGCGMGAGDRQALISGACTFLDGFDISSRSIEVARERANELGFGDRMRYWVDDANSILLPENKYDIVFAFGALHHIENLEHICGQVRYSLKPGGLFFVNEYVGPSQFQWTTGQLDIINRVMSVLPPGWRRASEVAPVSKELTMKTDPSEAIRSAELIPILTEGFEVVDYCDYGGGLLYPLWGWGLNPDVFMEDRRVDKQVILKLLIIIDELLSEHGIVPSNYAQLLVRNNLPETSQEKLKRLSVNSRDRKRWTARWMPGTNFRRPRSRYPRRVWQTLRTSGVRGIIDLWREFTG